MGKKHLFTVRMLDSAANYMAHREHIEGRAGIEAYKKEVALTFPKRHVAYVRIYNEITQQTRYEGGWIDR